MLYTPPTGGAANDSYVGKNVAAGVQGSKVPPNAVEYPQREIMAVIAADPNLTPTNSDLGQMLKAITYLIAQGVATYVPPTALWHTGIDTSTSAASIAVSVAPSVQGRTADLAYIIIPAHDCAGATTITVAFGAGAVTAPLTRQDGAALTAGAYVAGQPLVAVDDGTAFRLIGLNSPAALIHSGDDTSASANTLTVTNLSPAITAYGRGQRYQVKVANTTTANAVLNITAKNGTALGNRAIIRSDGTPSQAGDLIAGQEADLIDDGTNVQIAGLRTSFLPSSGILIFSVGGASSFMVPAGVTQIKRGRVWAGGGGGGGSTGSGGAGSGGGGGGYAEATGLQVVPGSTLTINVGSAGTGGINGDGTSGTSSSIAITGQSAWISAGGGFGSWGNNAVQGSLCGAGGGASASGAALLASGGTASFGYSFGTSVLGAGSGGAGAFGGGPPTLNVGVGSRGGNFPAGGANGGVGGSNGGNGGNGLVILEY